MVSQLVFLTHALCPLFNLMDLRETSSFSKAIGSYAEIFYPKVGDNVLQTPSNGLWNRLLEQKVLSVLLVKFFLELHGIILCVP